MVKVAPSLIHFSNHLNPKVEVANSKLQAPFQTKKQQKRKSEKVWRKGKSQAAEQEEREKELRNVDNINRLLARADQIAFDCQEINPLRERSDSIKEFRRSAIKALENIRSHTTEDFEELVTRGKDFHVDIPEIDQLETLLKRLRWDDQARSKRPNPETMRQDQTLSDINDYKASCF